MHKTFLWLFVGFILAMLLVDIVEAGKLPAESSLLEVINDDFVSCGIRTRNGEVFRIVSVDLGFGFRETGNGVSLLFGDLSIASRELGLGSYFGYAVRHLKGKPR